MEGPFWSEQGFILSKGAGIDWTLTGMGISSVIRPSDSVEARQLGAGDGSRRGITSMTQPRMVVTLACGGGLVPFPPSSARHALRLEPRRPACCAYVVDSCQGPAGGRGAPLWHRSVIRCIRSAWTRLPHATVVLHHDEPTEGTAVQDFATTEWCRGKEGGGKGADMSNHRRPLGGCQQGGGRRVAASIEGTRSMRAATRAGSLERRSTSCTCSKPCCSPLVCQALVVFF